MSLRMASFLAIGLLLLLAAVSLLVGVMQFTWVSQSGESLIALSRFPRTAAAILTGSSLAVCGVILQTLVHNRFVEPMTTGTGEGAALGILITMLLFPVESLMLRIAFASLTALAANLVFLVMVQKLPPARPLLVPLVGIIYGGILGAIVTFVAYQFDLLQHIGVWLNGEFAGILKGRYEFLWLAGVVAGFTYLIADQLAIVGLGDKISTGLGLNYRQVILFGLLAVSVVSAMTVVVVGMVPFIGLVVPNLVSRILGDNLRKTLPITALVGAILVLACDILSRVIRYPYEIPVGTVFGVFGAAVFLWILYAPRKRSTGASIPVRSSHGKV